MIMESKPEPTSFETKINALLISPVDDVATVIVELAGGDRAVFLKNGEIMGQATRDIAQGSHVHDHNVDSPK